MKKFISNNTTKVLLIVVMAFIISTFLVLKKAKAQNTFGQYLIPISVQGGDSIGQSFVFSGGTLNKISFAVFSRYLTTDHLATLYIRSGNTPYGTILFQTSILVPSLHKFYPPSLLDTASLNTMDGTFWMAIQDSINSGNLDFYDLATDYNVDQIFPAGSMTIVIALDTNIRNPLAWDNFITGYTNCYTPSLCNATSPYGPLQSNVYQNGNIFWGGTNFPLSMQVAPFISDADLAFEVTYTNIGTGMEEISIDKGKVVIPNECRDCDLMVTDMLGRQILNQKVKSGEEILLPKKQLVVVSLIKDGIMSSKKVVVME